MCEILQRQESVLIATYHDHSELLYYPVEKYYGWMRPNENRTRMCETRINATKHMEAVFVVRKRMELEERKRQAILYRRYKK